MGDLYCDFEPPEFYSEKQCVARKPHRCCETGAAIKPGEKYWRCMGKWDGSIMVFRQSEFAYRFARKINGVEPRNPDLIGTCVPFGGVGDHISEMRHDLPPEWVAEWDAHLASLHGPALAAALSPSVKESPDV